MNAINISSSCFLISQGLAFSDQLTLPCKLFKFVDLSSFLLFLLQPPKYHNVYFLRLYFLSTLT